MGSLATRLLHRELYGSKRGAAVNEARRLYECFYPNTALLQLDAPEAHICRFTPDGQHLVCFAAAFQQLVLYRFLGHSLATSGDADTVPPEELRKHFGTFASFFQPSYRVPVAVGAEALCKDFCLFMGRDGVEYVLLASQTPAIDPVRPTGGTAPPVPPSQVPAAPYVESTTFHLIRLSDGYKSDTVSFDSDFIHLHHNNGASLCGDLLAILAIRTQTIHLLRLRVGGHLLRVRVLGPHIEEDDELAIQMMEDAEARWQQDHVEAQRNVHAHAGPSGRPLMQPPIPHGLTTSAPSRLRRLAPASATPAAAAAAALPPAATAPTGRQAAAGAPTGSTAAPAAGAETAALPLQPVAALPRTRLTARHPTGRGLPGAAVTQQGRAGTAGGRGGAMVPDAGRPGPGTPGRTLAAGPAAWGGAARAQHGAPPGRTTPLPDGAHRHASQPAVDGLRAAGQRSTGGDSQHSQRASPRGLPAAATAPLDPAPVQVPGSFLPPAPQATPTAAHTRALHSLPDAILQRLGPPEDGLPVWPTQPLMTLPMPHQPAGLTGPRPVDRTARPAAPSVAAQSSGLPANGHAHAPHAAAPEAPVMRPRAAHGAGAAQCCIAHSCMPLPARPPASHTGLRKGTPLGRPAPQAAASSHLMPPPPLLQPPQDAPSHATCLPPSSVWHAPHHARAGEAPGYPSSSVHQGPARWSAHSPDGGGTAAGTGCSDVTEATLQCWTHQAPFSQAHPSGTQPSRAGGTPLDASRDAGGTLGGTLPHRLQQLVNMMTPVEAGSMDAGQPWACIPNPAVAASDAGEAAAVATQAEVEPAVAAAATTAVTAMFAQAMAEAAQPTALLRQQHARDQHQQQYEQQYDLRQEQHEANTLPWPVELDAVPILQLRVRTGRPQPPHQQQCSPQPNSHQHASYSNTHHQLHNPLAHPHQQRQLHQPQHQQTSSQHSEEVDQHRHPLQQPGSNASQEVDQLQGCQHSLTNGLAVVRPSSPHPAALTHPQHPAATHSSQLLLTQLPGPTLSALLHQPYPRRHQQQQEEQPQQAQLTDGQLLHQQPVTPPSHTGTMGPPPTRSAWSVQQQQRQQALPLQPQGQLSPTGQRQQQLQRPVTQAASHHSALLSRPLLGPRRPRLPAPLPPPAPAATAPALLSVGAGARQRRGVGSAPGDVQAPEARAGDWLMALQPPVPAAAEDRGELWEAGGFQQVLAALEEEIAELEEGAPPLAAAAARPVAAALPPPRQIEGLRQRLLAHVFKTRMAAAGRDRKRRRQEASTFHQQFNWFCSLVMWKLQLLDRNHLLIDLGMPTAPQGDPAGGEWAAGGQAGAGTSGGAGQSQLFVVYDVVAGRVLVQFHSASERLLKLFLRHADLFQASYNVSTWERHTFSHVHCGLMRENVESQLLLRGEPAERHAAVRKVLSALPCVSQALCPSPYLDPSLYSYEEKQVSAFVRPRHCSEAPARFHLRSAGPGSDRVLFRLDPGLPRGPQVQAGRGRRWAVLHLFHPMVPFVLSVLQAPGQAPTVNVHFRL